MVSDAEVVSEQVIRAFSARSRRDDDEIAAGRDRYTDYEGNHVAASFCGKDWSGITSKSL